MSDHNKTKEDTIFHFSAIHSLLSVLFDTSDFWIAGGAIRDYIQSNKELKDYDIFVNNKHSFSTISKSLEKAGYKEQIARENSVIYEKDGESDIDLVRVDTCGGLVIDGFDLTCCSAQFGPDGFKHHPEFFADNDDKIIKINKLTLPYYTYKRIAKHIRKGYVVSDMVLAEVMEFAVHEMEKEEAPKSNDPKSEGSSGL